MTLGAAMRIALIILVLLVAGFALWVRLAPTDAARWHRLTAARSDGDWPEVGGHKAARRVTGTDALSELDQIARATPRTKVIAGSVAEGMVTYETRSSLWGFPDYTTAVLADGDAGPVLTVYGRLRFGKSDMGVNKARVTDWLAQLDEAGVFAD